MPMMAAGLWTPRKQRAAQIHQLRNRQAYAGELIQIDGSNHAWFEARGPRCTLLVFIDDATSRLMQLHFVPTESSFAYFETTRACLEQNCKPMAFYREKASLFRATRASTDVGRGSTQYGRTLFEPNIAILCIKSSEAKGRVERAHLTLQDRLIKELRLCGISTLEAANAFAPHFKVDFNARLAKSPKRDFDAHRLVRPDEDIDLIFTLRLQREVSLSLALQHDRVIYLLKDTPTNRKLIRRYIHMCVYPGGRIQLRADGVCPLRWQTRSVPAASDPEAPVGVLGADLRDQLGAQATLWVQA